MPRCRLGSTAHPRTPPISYRHIWRPACGSWTSAAAQVSWGQALCKRAEFALDGIDISSASLKQAQKRGIYTLLLQHDLQKTPLPVNCNTYDVAATVGVLTYIANAETLLRDLCRTVRSGGVIAFTQRTDLWDECGFDQMIMQMEAEGVWQRDKVSEPMPYLPGNDEFADEIRVIHTLCRVT